jgi:hypothetical protein
MRAFGRVLRAEWTKFASLRLMVWGSLAAAVLTVVLSLLTGSTNVIANAPLGTCRFVHQPLTGDGSLVVRVATQEGVSGDPSGPQAKAGIMIKESTDRESRYAALMVTPDLGVRLQANFTTDIAGSKSRAPRWLKLTRSGAIATGYESADGVAWSRVGQVDLGPVPRTLRIGLFSAAPGVVGNVSDGTAEAASSRFERVSIAPGPGAPWRHQDVGEPPVQGSSTEVAAGAFLVAGSGDLWYAPITGVDRTGNILKGIVIGLMIIIAMSVLFVTSEYARGMIRTTFAASPRRGRVLAAKAVVVGGTAFAAGVPATFAGYAIALLREGDTFVPAGGLPRLQPLSDPTVLRAVVGSALLLALVAVFSLGVGMILRRTAAAVTLVIGVVVLPVALGGLVGPDQARQLELLTPSGGFAIQRTVTETLSGGPAPVAPWAGFAVLCSYAAGAMAVAYWLLRRRDT